MSADKKESEPEFTPSAAVQNCVYVDGEIPASELKELKEEYGNLFPSKEQFAYFCMLPLSKEQRQSFVLMLQESASCSNKPTQ